MRSLLVRSCLPLLLGACLGAPGSLEPTSAHGQALHSADFCGDANAPLGSAATCPADAAAQAGAHAVCVCGDYTNQSVLMIDRYYLSTASSGADIGVAGGFSGASTLLASGDVTVLGTAGLNNNGYVSVGGDLRVLGPTSVNSSIQVGGDASFGGNVAAQSLWARGGWTVAPGAQVSVPGAQAPQSGKVDATPVCDCTADANAVAAFARGQGDFDNETIGLDERSLQGIAQGTRLSLPCGRFHLSGIAAAGDLDIYAQGRVALFIDGDVRVAGALNLQAAPGARLDVFIGGNLQLVGAANLGNATDPGLARIYVGGDSLSLGGGGANINAQIYAPAADAHLDGAANITGALYVRNLFHVGSLLVHHVTDLATGAGTCSVSTPPSDPNTPPPSDPNTPPPSDPNTPPPSDPNTPPPSDPNTPPPSDPNAPPQCNSCDDCSGLPCSGGACVPCSDDLPCCIGYACRDGACVGQ